ncbi:hypothetical protein [Falsiroseomonas tokyonensis]|uniref:Uncharacterized protein n=1 Tax=Falsiroseomonas tokyonensis TaxID=430521 RepID=A0ABV7BZ81_9PROT|nr:hypothetical protein [Falsiroseomonas tokyonensis]MBU8540855.1 hypothetical protein [Falsiroseomonas tokyonensis]
MTDTSSAAIERLARCYDLEAARFAPGMPGQVHKQETAATLRALAAERDALRAALVAARQTILDLKPMADVEGSDDDWVGDIDAALARIPAQPAAQAGEGV